MYLSSSSAQNERTQLNDIYYKCTNFWRGDKSCQIIIKINKDLLNMLYLVCSFLQHVHVSFWNPLQATWQVFLTFHKTYCWSSFWVTKFNRMHQVGLHTTWYNLWEYLQLIFVHHWCRRSSWYVNRYPKKRSAKIHWKIIAIHQLIKPTERYKASLS